MRRIPALVALAITVSALGCATPASRAAEDAEVRQIFERLGTRTFDAGSEETRAAIVGALGSDGYDVVVDTARYVATGPRVEERALVESPASVPGLTAAATEVTWTRSWEAVIEALPDGPTRVTLTPRIRMGATDLTAHHARTGRTFEYERINDILNRAQHILDVTRISRDPVDI